MMKQEENRYMTYVVSNEAKKIGYNVAQTKSGEVFIYTNCKEGDISLEQMPEYKWADKVVVYQGYEEEIVAIKQYNAMNYSEKMIKYPQGNEDFQFDMDNLNSRNNAQENTTIKSKNKR